MLSRLRTLNSIKRESIVVDLLAKSSVFSPIFARLGRAPALDESTKSSRFFCDFQQSILSQSVLDIGAGRDPVVNHAQVFDQQHGDANHISQFVQQRFDCVYSSHCLEHMMNPQRALLEWWKLVKPGGYLFFIVPDEDLYEQGEFPSRFNSDHKHTFTISKKKSWSPVSHNLMDLVKVLPEAELRLMAVNDHGYDRGLQKHGPVRSAAFEKFLNRQILSLEKRGYHAFSAAFKRGLQTKLLVDQTQYDALAQIEVILQKRLDAVL